MIDLFCAMKDVEEDTLFCLTTYALKGWALPNQHVTNKSILQKNLIDFMKNKKIIELYTTNNIENGKNCSMCKLVNYACHLNFH